MLLNLQGLPWKAKFFPTPSLVVDPAVGAGGGQGRSGGGNLLSNSRAILWQRIFNYLILHVLSKFIVNGSALFLGEERETWI